MQKVLIALMKITNFSHNVKLQKYKLQPYKIQNTKYTIQNTQQTKYAPTGKCKICKNEQFELQYNAYNKKNARKSTRRCASKTYKDCRDCTDYID